MIWWFTDNFFSSGVLIVEGLANLHMLNEKQEFFGSCPTESWKAVVGLRSGLLRLHYEVSTPAFWKQLWNVKSVSNCLLILADHLEWAYLPNPGRLRELIYPGAPVWLKPVHSVKRKLAYEAVLGYDSVLVCLYAALANKLFLESLDLLGLGGNVQVLKEVSLGHSRLDFSVDGRLVEVKSVTLVQDGLGLFPDAPQNVGLNIFTSLPIRVKAWWSLWCSGVMQKLSHFTVPWTRTLQVP